ncbi:MAG TPA: hypothetical protein VG963_04155 [Polyangiaceae bacterium]|nr:hypothetical protein [Polyangiaceae bacterium]
MLLSPQVAVSGKYVLISCADRMMIAVLDGDDLIWQGGIDVDGDVWSPQSSTAVAFGPNLTVHAFVEKSGTLYYSKGQLDANKLTVAWSIQSTPVCKGDSVAAACNGNTLLYAYTVDRTAYWATWSL